MQDITNERKKIRHKKLQGRSPIQALFGSLLGRDGFISYSKYLTPEEDLMTYLFMIHKPHLKIYARNSEVTILDSIYKTNMFDMPLLNFVELIVMNTNFFIASTFLPSETVSDFKWAFQKFKFELNKTYLPYS